MHSLWRAFATVRIPGRCTFAILSIALATLAVPATSRSDTLFVSNASLGTIGEYDSSGATVNASLITGLKSPTGIAVSGSNLFVAELGNGTIGEYTTSGATVNASLITGLDSPFGIVVVPEPSTALLLSAGFVGLAVRARRAFGVSSAAQF